MRRDIAAILCSTCLLLLVACGQGTGGVGNASNTPTALHVTLPPPRHPVQTFHPIDKTIDNTAAVQRLYAAALTQTALPKDKTIMCPADIGLTYHMVFLNGSQVLRTADLDATGCQLLHLGPHDVRMPNSAFLSLFQQTLTL